MFLPSVGEPLGDTASFPITPKLFRNTAVIISEFHNAVVGGLSSGRDVRKRRCWRRLFGEVSLIGTDRKETVVKVIFVLNP